MVFSHYLSICLSLFTIVFHCQHGWVVHIPWVSTGLFTWVKSCKPWPEHIPRLFGSFDVFKLLHNISLHVVKDYEDASWSFLSATLCFFGRCGPCTSHHFFEFQSKQSLELGRCLFIFFITSHNCHHQVEALEYFSNVGKILSSSKQKRRSLLDSCYKLSI